MDQDKEEKEKQVKHIDREGDLQVFNFEKYN